VVVVTEEEEAEVVVEVEVPWVVLPDQGIGNAQTQNVETTILRGEMNVIAAKKPNQKD
jgi:hypothetical protein